MLSQFLENTKKYGDTYFSSTQLRKPKMEASKKFIKGKPGKCLKITILIILKNNNLLP